MNNLLEQINLPKMIIDKSEALLKTLLGEAAQETGHLIGDQIRLYRFRNQVSILAKAQDILGKKGITANSVSIKTLIPMIENASLEEEVSLQEMWANLIANTSADESPNSSLHSICSDILKGITPNDALFLRVLLMESVNPGSIKGVVPPRLNVPTQFFDNITKQEVRLSDLADAMKISGKEVNIICDNLIRFQLISSGYYTDADGIEMGTKGASFTRLGFEFYCECTGFLKDELRTSKT